MIAHSSPWPRLVALARWSHRWQSGQVLLQFEGAGMRLVGSGVISLVLLKLIDLTVGLRVSDEAELEGLDLALHGEVIHG